MLHSQSNPLCFFFLCTLTQILPTTLPAPWSVGSCTTVVLPRCPVLPSSSVPWSTPRCFLPNLWHQVQGIPVNTLVLDFNATLMCHYALCVGNHVVLSGLLRYLFLWCFLWGVAVYSSPANNLSVSYLLSSQMGVSSSSSTNFSFNDCQLSFLHPYVWNLCNEPALFLPFACVLCSNYILKLSTQ